MNQKDYKEIAKIIKEAESRMAFGKGKLSKELADFYEFHGFSEFNREQFLKDCGVE